MTLNLYTAARGPVQSVNPDICVIYLASQGYVTDGNGNPSGSYATPFTVFAQVQPPSGRDIDHINFFNLQGVMRTVIMYGAPLAINRVSTRGGDLLLFPQTPGAPLDNWLVTYVDETWSPDRMGWSRIIVTLQTDGRVIALNQFGLPALNSNGSLVYT